MATTLQDSWIGPSLRQARWAALASSENGETWDCGQFGDKTITVTGTFDTATITLLGSNDGTNWFTIQDFLGTNITFTASGMRTLGNSPRYIRPSAGAGAGSVNVDVIIIARGSAR